MKKINILFMALILFNTFIYANQNYSNNRKYNNRDDNQADELAKYGFSQEQEYPFDKEQTGTHPYAQERRFKLDLDADTIRKTNKSLNEHNNLMEGTLDISIIQKPLTKVLKTVDTLYLHPSFITTIILPKNLKVKNCLPSFSTTHFIFEENTIRIQPSKTAKDGNISIGLTDGKKNYTMDLFIKKYFKDDNCINNGNNYICSQDYLSTIIKYVPAKTLSKEAKMQIVEDYLILTKKTKIDIKKNLDYLTLKKGNEIFYIIRDDEFGDIFRNGISLSVRNSLN